MTDFINNGASELPGVKTDARSPSGAATEWAAADSNKVRQALLDVRTTLISGPIPGLTTEIADRQAADAAIISAYTTADTAEAVARVAADALIIASGATPADVGLAPIIIGTDTRTVQEWLERTVNVVYVDSVAGSDSYTGRSHTAPLKTLAAANALANPGDTVLLARGSRFSYPDARFPGADDCVIGAFGSGPKPIIEMASIDAAGGWTQHGTYANVWWKEITHQTPVVVSVGTYGAVGPHFRLFDERIAIGASDRDVPYPMDGYWAGTDIDANVAYVDANPGTFTCHRTGSATKDPRTQIGSFSAFTYYVNLKSGVLPNDAAVQITVAEYAQMQYTKFREVRDVVFRRGATKELGTGRDGGQFVDCDFLDIPGHGFLGNITYLRCRAEGLDTARTFACGAYHGYLATLSSPPSRGVSVVDCSAYNFGVGIYSHGNGGTYEHEYYDVLRFTADGCAVAIGSGTNKYLRVKGLKATNCRVLTDAVNCCIEDFFFGVMDDTPAGGTIASAAGCHGVFKNGAIVFPEGIAFADNVYVWQGSAGAVPARLEFENCLILNSSFGTVSDPNNAWANVRLILRNSAITGIAVFKQLQTTNSYIGLSNWTLEHLASIYNTADDSIDADTICGAITQSFEAPVGASDVLWRTTAEAVSGTIGDAFFTVTSYNNQVEPYNAVKILNADGAGGDLILRCNAVEMFKANAIAAITSVLPYSFAGKAISIGTYNKVIFPEVAGTARFQGTTVEFSEPRHFRVGSAFFVRDYGRKPAFGIRTLISYDQATGIGTMDLPVEFEVSGAWYTDIPSGGGTVPRPWFDVAFQFPVYGTSLVRGGVTYPRVEIDREGADDVVSPFTASANFPRLGNYYTDGTAVTGQTGIYERKGYADIGYSVAETDVILFQILAMPDEIKPQFPADPRRGNVQYVKDSYLEKKNMGVINTVRWPFMAGGK